MKYILNFDSYLNEGIGIDMGVKLVLDAEDQPYNRYSIIASNEIVGMIEFYTTRYEIEIAFIEINENKRGKKFGKLALQELVKMYKKNTLIHDLKADCVSQESFFTFISAYGKPKNFYTISKELKSYDEILDYLPKNAPYDSKGNMIGSSDSSVTVYYNFKSLARKIK